MLEDEERMWLHILCHAGLSSIFLHDSGQAGMTNPALGADVNSLKEKPQDLMIRFILTTLVLINLIPFI